MTASEGRTVGSSADTDYDVAIVGYGPVGQTAAILLGRLGWSVGVFERWPIPYPRPRAVHYDDEVARIFQRLGIAEELEAITEPATTYEWQNARGERLLLIDRGGPGPSGWPSATMFNQPELERLLDRAAVALPSVEVNRGWEVREICDLGTHVTLGAHRGRVAQDGCWSATGQERELSARWLIGCDGAGSRVREAMGTAVEDMGFAFDWLIADTVPHDPALLAGVNLQRCDPRRPTTIVSGGPGRRRWEWMLLPGETRAQMEDPDVVWELLAGSGLGPQDLTLERFTVYTFRARWAERWREGRLLLAGDAAHQMPPFAGQGMCSGIRDALTLAWHLDLVLAGVAAETTLDAYTSERCGHLQSAIATSVELGKVICIADEAQASARDEAMLTAATDPDAPPLELPVPALGRGLHDGGVSGSEPLLAGPEAAGTLFPQGRIPHAGSERLLEDTLPFGFALYALGVDPVTLLDAGTHEYLRTIGCQLVRLEATADPVYLAWFAANDCTVALVRPDFYVFGTATNAVQTRALTGRLEAALTHTDRREETIAT